jgi:hypothetical protein
MLRTWTDDATYRHPITALEIDAPNATVEVGPGAAGQVKIHSRLTWVSTKPRVRLTWDRDILRIAVTCDRAALFDSRECGAGLDLRVPAATAMRAEAASGVLGVRGLTGDLRLQVSSGAIRMTGVRGDVRAQAASGRIVGTALGASRVDATLTSGELRLGFATPPQRVDATATSGTVGINLPPGEQYAVIGASGSGPRNIAPELVDGRSHREINVTTGSGPVHVGYSFPS